MRCIEFVFLDLPWHTRDQLWKWSNTNNEFWKTGLFKFVTIGQTGQSWQTNSELTTALNVFDTDYQLEYSESYSGTVHQEIAIEGYQ